jgi:hypothetical protein
VAKKNYSAECLMQTSSKLAAILADRNGIEIHRPFQIVIAAMVMIWRARLKQS